MDIYIKQWNDLILNCSFDNTYKMAWSKALVELTVNTNEPLEDIVIFDINDIAKLCLKYYWNQTNYFDLIQSPNIKKPPGIITYTKDLITLFFNKKQSVRPIRFEKIDFKTMGLAGEYELTLKNIVRTLKQDVCWRFRETYKIYELDRNKGKVFINKSHVFTLKEYGDFLFTLINYRWTQMYECVYNYFTRVRIIYFFTNMHQDFAK
ncbi:hypothetical protein [Neobacillus cucumis]|uniref:hypothetical protein n=1 Tax=Neobacillus cucumis TaxID=1740721 RepID=UPI0028534716|nr:hypothetical protein [Neobacillus cucumis]MDR4948126.1 hypothetical protein [Neobacillus cucumis]